MITFGAIIENIMVDLFGGMNDHELAFMFFRYLSHFKTKFGDSKSHESLRSLLSVLLTTSHEMANIQRFLVSGLC